MLTLFVVMDNIVVHQECIAVAAAACNKNEYFFLLRQTIHLFSYNMIGNNIPNIFCLIVNQVRKYKRFSVIEDLQFKKIPHFSQKSIKQLVKIK